MDNHRTFLLLRRAADDLGVNAWAVGGYVRDRLLGRQTDDLDVVVEGGRALDLAVRFAELAGAPAPALFPHFGTAHVAAPDLEVEFVSARAESYAPDSRKPFVRPASVQDDLRRRDFTVNAMLMTLDGVVAWNLPTVRAGYEDLASQILRTPLDPLVTFSDDPLRMVRAARFVSQLGFGLAPDVLPAMRLTADRLAPPKVSVERVTTELRKLLVGRNPWAAMEVLREGGLLAVVLPELAAMAGVEQNEHHLYDVWEHTMRVVEGVPPMLALRLAALFHDVGKPVTADGHGHFYDHQDVGADMTRDVLTRLRFSNEEVDAVVKLVRLHMTPMRYRPDWGWGSVRRLRRDAGDLLPMLMRLARADAAASARPDRESHDDLERRLDAVNAERPSRFVLPVTGHDVMQVLGLRQGPEVGAVLRSLSDRVLDGKLPPERDVLLAVLTEEGR